MTFIAFYFCGKGIPGALIEGDSTTLQTWHPVFYLQVDSASSHVKISFANSTLPGSDF